MLLVDAAQGIEAQTLANFHLARDAGLTIVPVLNKIDLPQADPTGTARELAELVGCDPEEILERLGQDRGGRAGPARARSSGASRRPRGDADDAAAGADLRLALRPVPRRRGLRAGEGRRAALAREGALHGRPASTRRPRSAGSSRPRRRRCRSLEAGEVGYLVTGLKDVHQVKVGDTVTLAGAAAAPASRCPATGSRSRWCGAGCTRPRAATTRSCARRSTSSS